MPMLGPGEIAGFAASPDGRLHNTVYYYHYRTLDAESTEQSSDR